MLRNLKYKVDSNESIRKLRRYIDGKISYRKLFIILLLAAIILLYFGPIVIGYFTRGEQTLKGKYSSVCIAYRVRLYGTQCYHNATNMMQMFVQVV